MPIYEYYCPDNNTIYQFFAKTLAQGRKVPPCPDNPKFRMEKIVSAFAVTKGAKEPAAAPDGAGSGEDARLDAAMQAMESEFSGVDENDPKAMGRMMRRMAELSGEKMDAEMEEMVRKLEEGADPEALEDQLGGGDGEADDGEGPEGPPADPKEGRHRFRARRAPIRDPKLYDYE